jgi:serine/threonine protein kinase
MQAPLPSVPGFEIGRKLGSGGFGDVYRAVHLSSHTEVAAKLVVDPARVSALRSESRVYQSVQGHAGFATVLAEHFGSDVSFLILNLLGRNLRDITASLGPFGLKTILMIADQLLCSLEYLHSCGFVDCDLTPDNICVGSGPSSNSIFLIDLGLALEIGRPPAGFEKGPIPFRGTPAFASVAAHKGQLLRPKDDIESLIYTLVYLLKGELPWLTNDDRDRIFSIKSSIQADELFEGVPDELKRIYQEVRQMSGGATPQYAKYRKMLRDLFIGCRFVFDYKYDWLEVARTTFTFPKSKTPGATRSTPKFRLSPRVANPAVSPRVQSRSPVPRGLLQKNV